MCAKYLTQLKSLLKLFKFDVQFQVQWMNKVPDDILSIYPTLLSLYKNHPEPRF